MEAIVASVSVEHVEARRLALRERLRLATVKSFSVVEQICSSSDIKAVAFAPQFVDRNRVCNALIIVRNPASGLAAETLDVTRPHYARNVGEIVGGYSSINTANN